MAEPDSKPKRTVDDLRKAIGIKDERPKVRVGPLPINDTLEERQRLYQEEMEFLTKGGANYSGREGWLPLKGLRK